MDNYFMLDGEKIKMSDETAENLRKQQKPKPYPLAAITKKKDRLILNLPDTCLTDRYKGRIISLDVNGSVMMSRVKNIAILGCIYSEDMDVQVFPVLPGT